MMESIFAIVFGVIILAAISATAYNLYLLQLGNEIQNNLKQLGVEISNNILKLYDTGKSSRYLPGANESSKIGEIDLKLPSQVSGRNYEVILVEANPVWTQISNITISGQTPPSSITLSGAKIILRTTQTPKITVEQDVPNIDAFIQGRSENGLNSKLTFYRYSMNGTVKNKIVLGDYNIIIDITSVS